MCEADVEQDGKGLDQERKGTHDGGNLVVGPDATEGEDSSESK